MTEKKLFSISLTEEQWDIMVEALYNEFVCYERNGQKDIAKEFRDIADLIADSLPEHEEGS